MQTMESRRFIAIALSLLLTVGLGAQNTEWDAHERSSAWSYSLGDVTAIRMQNPASLSLVDTLKVAYASAGITYKGGDFRSQNDPSWSLGERLEAQSTLHRGRVSMKGAFLFSNLDSWNQCGSMLIANDAYPVGIYEFTPGRKTHQSYGVSGLVGYQPIDGLRIGAGLDFLSENLAKRKDLRHSNYYLDLRATAGAVYSFNSTISLGLQYEYYKNYQCAEAEVIGQISGLKAFLDKGLGYGVYDVWNSGATHLKDGSVKGFPMNISKHSLALQFTYGGLFAEISGAMTSKAVVGEKNVVWFRYPYRELAGRLSWSNRRLTHFARFAFDIRSQKCDEAVVEKVTVGGVTNSEILGYTQIGESLRQRLALEYECRAVNRLTLLAGSMVTMQERQQTPSYPVSAFQGDTFLDVYARAYYDFDFGFTPQFNIAYRHSLGATDSASLVPTGGMSASEIYRNVDWILTENSYLRTDKTDLRVDLRYMFKFRMYIGLQGNVALGLLSEGVRTRYASSIYIGYKF